MKIKFIDIQNFRKLKCSRINFSDKETLFVGANNSGKTSAMDALRVFLLQKGKKQTNEDEQMGVKKFDTTDFTLSNWNQINSFGESWSTDNPLGELFSEWQLLCPSIDVWLSVDKNEVHKVRHLIPTLKWNGGTLGVRLIYQPTEIKEIQTSYLANHIAANDLLQNSTLDIEGDKQQLLSLWPKTLRDYLDRKLSSHFEMKAYILDPGKISETEVSPQEITDDYQPLNSYPFHGLFKVDMIEAQRGFSDPNSSHGNSNKSDSKLSTQLNTYYSRHLNPTELPDEGDITALRAIDTAKASFDERLNDSFKDALGEIKGLGYPGFNDPDIKLSSKINPVESLDHEAAILFEIQKQDDKIGGSTFYLPEKYNGLGYKNLIYMIFKLISFRDQWMRKGKASKRRLEEGVAIEPLHLVLIEEPEAHLHAQVQQVFIRKAYEVLRKGIDDSFSTQMVVSSHSSYLAHEISFEKLRYFKRKPAECFNSVPRADVIDLSKIFGDPNKRKPAEKQTAEFVARYLKTTHCDLFFANGIILVEGAAERMLLPHFINSHFDGIKGLNRSYISILEVGGAHAHRLRPLIDALGLPTLVITDMDAVDGNKKKQPVREKNYHSGSDTLKDWFEFKGKTLDELLDLPFDEKVMGNVRAAYQYGIQVEFLDDTSKQEAIPYTFEDAIALTNIELIKGLSKPTGMLAKMKEAITLDSLDKCCTGLYEALEKDKAKMALDLLFYVEPKELKVPKYIYEGLEWLQDELVTVSSDFLPKDVATSGVENDVE